jgi:hypothetical protein
MKIWRVLLTMALLPFLLIGGCAVVAWRKDEAAKKFCESLIPRIEAEKKKTGSYPDSLDASWWKDKKVPSLIDTQSFYFSHLNDYGFHFQNDMWVFDNVWGFRNNGWGWYGYDANFKQR